jgi:hypothetical protein
VGVFRSHKEAARLTNRTIGRFFLVMWILTVFFVVLVGVHYLLGWW